MATRQEIEATYHYMDLVIIVLVIIILRFV
jgi:hypothetical protein